MIQKLITYFVVKPQITEWYFIYFILRKNIESVCIFVWQSFVYEYKTKQAQRRAATDCLILERVG